MLTTQAVKAPEATGFGRFHLHPLLERAIAAAGYTQPRPVQERAIPPALLGRDVLGLAQTGTGKTAAFALPVLHRLLSAPRLGPRVLVIAPTRELAVQIDGEFRTLAAFTRLKTLTVYGGVSERSQIQGLRRSPDVIVACPGRLLDLLRQGEVRLDRVETLVLDEADHMFDMGFLPDVRRILAALPPQRQNLLFAATMPVEIRQLASDVLRDPVLAELVHSMPPSTIEHVLYPVPEHGKSVLLERLLAEDGFASAIIFARTKHRAKRLALQLSRAGHRATALQGNMSQGQRDRAMEGFRSRRFDVLVATDIVSRGIDVDQVSHVINFDIPGTPDAYTHRIGRTGRAERSGKACTFVTENDTAMVRAIERALGASIPRRYVEGIDRVYAAPQAAAGQRRPAGRREGGSAGDGRGRRKGRRHGASHDSVGAEIRASQSKRGRGEATPWPADGDSRGPSAAAGSRGRRRRRGGGLRGRPANRRRRAD
jgi:ATP-dependent RNA helicase RhlE